MLAVLCWTSCGKDRWPAYHEDTARNEWIDSIMRLHYLWADEMPEFKELAKYYFQTPETYLAQVRYADDDSYTYADTIEADYGYGFLYSLKADSYTDSVYRALVTYVAPGTPADKAGLERGEWIIQIDGSILSTSNKDELAEGGSHKLGIGTYQTDTVVYDHDATLPASTVITDIAIPVATTLQTSSHTIGYMVLKWFDEDANSTLLEASSEFKEAGVDALVLDLRYCTGSELGNLDVVASIAAPASALGSRLATLEYNEDNPSPRGDLMLSADLLSGGANLNLNELYVLTSSSTKGTAEMLINCLKPYMTVYVIGATTGGQSYATEVFHNYAYSWSLHVVTCRVLNTEGTADYEGSGFTPDVAATDLSDYATVLPLGDPEETLLSAAITLIEE